MSNIIIGALLLVLCSCTHTSYLSSGKIPVYIGAHEKHVHEVVSEGKNSFFYWGMVPEEHKVYIDRELAQAGLISAARLNIEEYQKPSDFLISVLSLGMFITKSYRISGYGMRVDQE